MQLTGIQKKFIEMIALGKEALVRMALEGLEQTPEEINAFIADVQRDVAENKLSEARIAFLEKIMDTVEHVINDMLKPDTYLTENDIKMPYIILEYTKSVTKTEGQPDVITYSWVKKAGFKGASSSTPSKEPKADGTPSTRASHPVPEGYKSWIEFINANKAYWKAGASYNTTASAYAESQRLGLINKEGNIIFKV